MRKHLPVAALAATAAMLAGGAAHATSPAYGRCVDKSGGVTSAMRDCASAEYDRQDRELNAQYKLARARLSPDGQVRLRLEERAWLKRRTARCAALADADGTAALLDADSCTLEMTDKRIAELKAMGAR